MSLLILVLVLDVPDLLLCLSARASISASTSASERDGQPGPTFAYACNPRILFHLWCQNEHFQGIPPAEIDTVDSDSYQEWLQSRIRIIDRLGTRLQDDFQLQSIAESTQSLPSSGFYSKLPFGVILKVNDGKCCSS